MTGEPPDTIAETVIRLIAQGYTSSKDIIERSGTSPAAVRNVLSQLVKERTLRRVKHGHYAPSGGTAFFYRPDENGPTHWYPPTGVGDSPRADYDPTPINPGAEYWRMIERLAALVRRLDAQEDQRIGGPLAAATMYVLTCEIESVATRKPSRSKLAMDFLAAAESYLAEVTP
jgi:hypothetical protein